MVTDSSKWSCSTLCASKNVVYCFLSSTEVSSFCLFLLICSCVCRFDTTLSNNWYALSNGLSVLVSGVLGITICVKALHLVRNLTYSIFIFSILSCFVQFLVDASLVSPSRSWSNSPSSSFCVLTAEVNPSWWRWIAVLRREIPMAWGTTIDSLTPEINPFQYAIEIKYLTLKDQTSYLILDGWSRSPLSFPTPACIDELLPQQSVNKISMLYILVLDLF